MLALLLCVGALPAIARAQDKPLTAYFRETWTTRQGLPHNQVNAIAQTPDGYLWFGTWEGLVRYNGLEFHSFDRGNTPELKDNGVRSVRASADGALVIGTSRGGVTVKRGDHWRTWRVKDGLAQEEIMDAIFDRRGRLWVATENAGIDVVDGSRVDHFTTRNGLPSAVTYGLLLDRDGSVWAATARGLVHFLDGRLVVYAQASGLPPAPVFRVFQDAGGRLFVGTERGVYRRQGERFVLASALLPDDGVPSMAQDGAGNLWVGSVNNGLLRLGKSGVETFTSLRGLPNNRVAALLVDREGSIWAGTNAGLLRLSDAPFSTYNGDHGLSDDYVRAVLESRDGSLWLGTSRGLNRWRGGRLEASYTAADGLPSDSVLSLLEDRDGSLLVGSYTAGVMRLRDGKLVAHYDNAHGMPGSNQVRALAQQADGTLWLGTNRGLVRMRDGAYAHFGVAQGLPREFIISLQVARDGSLWVGTANGAARIVDGRVQALDMRGMNGAQDVFDFHEDADGTLWFATDRGLLRYRGGRLQALGLAQGLPVDTLFAVVDDGIGSLWLTSNRGVMRVGRSEVEAVMDGRKPRLELDRFGEADGLASYQCNGGSGPSALRDRGGRIWIATAGGAAVVEPKALRAYKRTLPPVLVEQVLANDRDVQVQGRLELPAGTRKLEFHYASLTFQTPRFVRYRYQLQGVDRDWIERGNQRVAQYTNVAPGNYRFRVNASAPGLGHGWSPDVTTLEIGIAPRLWQRPWFLPLLLLFGVLALAGLYRWRLGHAQRAPRPGGGGGGTHPRPARADRTPARIRPREIIPGRQAAGTIRGVRTAGPRGRAHRPRQPPQHGRGAGARVRTGGAVRAATELRADRHRPLQAHQRWLLARRRRPRAGRDRADHAQRAGRAGHAGALGRRGVRGTVRGAGAGRGQAPLRAPALGGGAAGLQRLRAGLEDDDQRRGGRTHRHCPLRTPGEPRRRAVVRSQARRAQPHLRLIGALSRAAAGAGGRRRRRRRAAAAPTAAGHRHRGGTHAGRAADRGC
ncbi:MAG: GGDEF domain-containing protein [Thermomonas sp.]|nr:GGDEF domain-containing protein [Thermomonas sp.]